MYFKKFEIPNTLIKMKKNTILIAVLGTFLSAQYSHAQKTNNDTIKTVNIPKVTVFGKVDIKSNNPGYFVMAFRNCENLSLENITIGHEVKEECSGGTVHFENSKNVQISNSNIYGSGVIGLSTAFSSNFKVLNTRIYDCSRYITEIIHSKNISFRNSKLEDSKLNKVIYLVNTENISFNGCIFRNIQ